MTTDLDEFTINVLMKLQEECAEVIQITSKLLFFGPNNWHPDDPNKTNTNLLEQELGDVLAMMDLVVETGIGITDGGLLKAKMAKFRKLAKYHKEMECRITKE